MTLTVEGRLLVVGDANPDLVLGAGQGSVRFGEEEVVVPAWELTVGGSATILACAAARLGLTTEFIGAFGDDAASQILRDGLLEAGVEIGRCRTDADASCGITVVLSNADDRAIITGASTVTPVSSDDVLPALSDASHVHVGGLFIVPGLSVDVTEILTRAHENGATTSLDTNWDPAGGWQLPKDLSGVLDSLLINEQEAKLIAGCEDLDEAGAGLTRLADLAVVKRGPLGARAYARGVEPVEVSAFPTQVVDTTGAGDNFDAGFICGQMLELGLRESLELGCACGSLSTRELGGTTARVGLEESLALARSVAAPREQ